MALLESLEQETTDVWDSSAGNRSAMDSREDLNDTRQWVIDEEAAPLRDSPKQGLMNSPSYGTTGR